MYLSSEISRNEYSSLSYGSLTSPTISSTTSSNVTNPDVPPHSSTAIAIFFFLFLKSSNKSFICFVSGTNKGSLDKLTKLILGLEPIRYGIIS